MQAIPGGPGRSRHTLGLPDHSGEALAEPFPVQAASGTPCGRPGPPVAKAAQGLGPLVGGGKGGRGRGDQGFCRSRAVADFVS